MIETKGTVIDIRYRNETNNYSIFKIETDEGEITVVGTVLDLNIGDYLSITGELAFHNDFGEQIKLKKYDKIMPTSIDQIIRYLSSGIISNIKKKRAREIVKKFGEDTIRIMLEEPKRLLEVSGIGEKTLEKIHRDIVNANESREVIIYLQKFNLGNKLTSDIYAKYRSQTIDIIEMNPYQIADDIKGVGFLTADKIALMLGIKRDSYFRIKSGATHVLLESSLRDGNCYLPKRIFLEQVSSLLAIDKQLIEEHIPNLVFDSRIKLLEHQGETIVYLKSIYDIEISISSKLNRLMSYENPLINIDFDSEISQIERLENIEYSSNQKRAIKNALSEKVFIITGGPGTGKTTIIKAIMSILRNIKKKYILCAPTGRAAKRMEESTGEEAFTIHRMLGYKSLDDELALEYNEDNPLEYEVIIVDEMSMVDIYLMNNLLKAIQSDTIVIFVGDSDQLPSVGPGNILNDMINSEIIPTVKLDIIFRQAEGSNIVKNAHLINQGKLPILNEENKDFFFIRTKNDYETLEKIVELVTKRIPSHYGVDPIKDIQVLSPTRRGVCGVDNLNRELQKNLNEEAFNKAQIVYGESIFRENDKVMQVKNNYDIELKDKFRNIVKGLYNGDIGFIRNVFLDTKTIEINFDDKIGTFAVKDLQEIVLSYSATIHKSQGSEFPIVIIPMARAPYMLLTRNILYTGITRGKSLVILVGDENIMREMIKNTYKQVRNSTLMHNLREMRGKLEEYFN